MRLKHRSSIVGLWQSGSITRRRLTNFIDSQGLGALAYPCFTPRQQAEVLRKSDITLADARILIALAGNASPAAPRSALLRVNGFAPMSADRGVSDRVVQLSRVFNTEVRVDQLQRALDRFDASVQAWTGGERRDPRFSWVVPNRLASSALAGVMTETFRTRLKDRNLGATLLEGAPALLSWLSVLSMEAAIEIDHLRAPDFPVVSLMIARGASSLGFNGRARPWLPRFPQKLQALPTTWLYQFDPSPRVGTILSRLERGGMRNVGHLAVLHPEGLHWIRRTPPESWRSVQLALKHPTAH